MENIAPAQRTEELMELIADIWKRSVEATHDFLSPEEIERLRRTLPPILANAEHLVVGRDGKGDARAFMTVNGDEIDMLFVEPESRNRGMGSELVSLAIEHLGARKLTVHGQNTEAVGFYEHMGLVVTGSALDDWGGAPHRVLTMEVPLTTSGRTADAGGKDG